MRGASSYGFGSHNKETPMTVRMFDISDVLSITTERLVSRRHISGVRAILDHMTGEMLSTHQLPRAQGMCRQHLLDQHPQLADVTLPDPPEGGWTKDTIGAWLDTIAAEHGTELPVLPLAVEDQAPQDPIEELCDMIGPEKVYVFPTNPRQGS